MKRVLARSILGMTLLTLSTYTARAQWVQTGEMLHLFDAQTVTAVVVSGGNIFAVTDENLFLSTNNGASWAAIDSGLPNVAMTLFAVSGGNVFTGDAYGDVYRSTNNGSLWNAVNGGVALPGGFLKSLAASGNKIFAGTFGGGVLLSADSGTTWTAADSGLTNMNVWSLAVCGSKIFTGTFAGVFVSANNGTSWTAADSGLPSGLATCFAVSGSNTFVGTNGSGVYLSANNGAIWTDISSNLTDNDINSILVSGNNIFAGTSGGVFRTTNNGTSWTEVDSGWPNNGATSLAICGTYIFAGTDGSGVWRRPLSEIIGVITPDPRRGVIEQAGLQIHSPSHANPNITIEFSLPHSDKVTVTLYDLSGHRVASLVNKYLGSGAYDMTWNTQGLAAGCYTVRMQAGSDTYVRSIPLFR